MIVENIYCTLGNEFTIWSTYILEGCAGFIVYSLTLIVILIILYYPLMFGLFLMFLYNAILSVWKRIGNLPDDINSKKWDKPKRFLTLAAKWHGKILHSYEVSGVENLPKEPAIIVYYHGAFPMDNYFFVHKIYRLTGKFLYSVIDHTLFNVPGINLFLTLHYTYHPTRERCINLLKEGHQLTVAPGGLREQNYGSNHYKLIWGKRRGFAHIAINAKVPIIPVFTQNIREGYITYGNIRPMRWLYEQNRWLAFPLYGMFPVKLITHIGKPIPYDPDVTAEKLAEKTQRAIEALQNKHQKIPGSILHALKQCFETRNKEKQ
ncbi:monoacylglycerol/Diacylglycerol O-acyltransferase-like [Pantherophis guttatus]|uniref:Monoacylglycerol/Diacylglycerol O-acyltransferase-like n=1 Tax=Pantherophis guttatus TaxID=94885 RepID=A0A6P9CP06_PANGU|nr:monoacylglycerol/Diacylglycerol O-acyltransferase-like [Pantherophis guttatus]